MLLWKFSHLAAALEILVAQIVFRCCSFACNSSPVHGDRNINSCFCMLQSLVCHEYNEDIHKDAAIMIIKVLPETYRTQISLLFFPQQCKLYPFLFRVFWMLRNLTLEKSMTLTKMLGRSDLGSYSSFD